MLKVKFFVDIIHLYEGFVQLSRERERERDGKNDREREIF